MTGGSNKHPFGTCLLSRDKPENRARWGPEGVGYADVVAPTVCAAPQQQQQCPHYHHRADADRTDGGGGAGGGALATPIHLLIASFRDRLCPRTLHNAFRRAENPDRIFVRVLEQTDPRSDLIDDAGCVQRFCSDYHPNDCRRYETQIRTVHIDASQAKGPTDARSKLSAMVHHDFVHREDPDRWDFHPVELHDFCLQTDSHMDFADRYDTELVRMHHRTENDYAVLSTYVADISQNNSNNSSNSSRGAVPHLCMVEFTTTIRNWGTKECLHLVRPKLTNALWGAGLSFHRCHAELAVPVDPYLDHVFDGEEGSRGIRFFTHGYDVYTPDRVLVTHDYKQHQSNPVVHSWWGHLKGNNHHQQQQREDAAETRGDLRLPFMEAIERERANLHAFGTKRVNLLLGIGPAPMIDDRATREELDRIRQGRFGLGRKRTLEQAAEFTGINLRERKMVQNKCGNLEWVPYEESSEYGIPEILSRGLAGGGPANVAPSQQESAAKVKREAMLEFTPEDVSEKANANIAAICGMLLAMGMLVRILRRSKKKGDKHIN